MERRVRRVSGSRKGNAILDSLVVLVVLFVLAVVTIIVRPILSDINDDMQADADMDTDAKAVLDTVNTKYTVTMDSAILLAYILLFMFAILASFLVETHPAFIAVAIVLMVVLVWLSGTLANTYEEIATETDIAAEANFPLTTFMMRHLVEYFIGVCMAVMIILYGKGKGQL